MTRAYLAFTDTGLALAKRLADALPGSVARCGQDGVSLAEWTSTQFVQSDALIFVGAAGIAVRAIAPHCKSKTTDPAVVDLGVRFLRTSALFYMLPAATNGIQGFFRGMGDLKVTLNSSMLNMGGRVAAAALFVLVMKMDIEALPFSYAVGWLLMLLYELPLLVRFLRSSEM